MKTKYIPDLQSLSKFDRRNLRDTALSFLNTRLKEMDSLTLCESFDNLHWKTNMHNERFLLWPISSTGKQSECFQFYVDENEELVKVVYIFLQGLTGVTFDVTKQMYSVFDVFSVYYEEVNKK